MAIHLRNQISCYVATYVSTYLWAAYVVNFKSRVQLLFWVLRAWIPDVEHEDVTIMNSKTVESYVLYVTIAINAMYHSSYSYLVIYTKHCITKPLHTD